MKDTERDRIIYMTFHHEWLSAHWRGRALAMSEADPMRRKTFMKANYHARRAKHFKELLAHGDK